MNLDAEVIKEFIQDKVPFVKRMKLEVMELKPRYVKLFVPLCDNENHIGSMYAGALFTIAEIPGGALFLTAFDLSRYYPLIKEMNIRFLKPARTDVTIECFISDEEFQRIQDELQSNNKAELMLHGEIKDTSGAVVAMSTGTYQFRAVGS